MKKETYELFKRIHESRGMACVRRAKTLNFSYNIFHTNFQELKNACAFIESPDSGLKVMSNQSGSGVRTHMEINRLFHNFLAGAQTLVEHTRNFVREHYPSGSLRLAYDQKVEADFSNDGLSRFIQDLRNFMLHRGLPNNSMSITARNFPLLGRVEVASTVALSKKDLETWKGWKPASWTFLALLEDPIKISFLALQYGDKVAAFHDWLSTQVKKYHADDLRELEVLHKEYERRLAKEGESSTEA